MEYVSSLPDWFLYTVIVYGVVVLVIGFTIMLNKI